MDSSNTQSVQGRFSWLKTKKGRIIIVIAIIVVALVILFIQGNRNYGPRPLTEEEIRQVQNRIQGEMNPPVTPLTEKEHQSVIKTIETDKGDTSNSKGLSDAELQSIINQIQKE